MYKALTVCTAEKSLSGAKSGSISFPASVSQDNLLNSDKVNILCIPVQLLQHAENEDSTLTHNAHTEP